MIREGRGSVSLLQRALGIGYGRAARLIDFMAEDGIVGEYNGSQAREVLMTLDQWSKMLGQEPEPPAANPKRNRILPDLEASSAPFDTAGSEETDDGNEDVPTPPPRRRATIQIARHDEDDEDEADEEQGEEDAEDADAYHSADEESDEDEEESESDGEIRDESNDDEPEDDDADDESEEVITDQLDEEDADADGSDDHPRSDNSTNPPHDAPRPTRRPARRPRALGA